MVSGIRRTLRELKWSLQEFYDAATVRIPPLPDYGPCRQHHLLVHATGYHVVEVDTVFVVSTCRVSEETDIVTRISPVIVSERYVKWDHARRVASAWNQLCSEAESDD